MRSKSSFPKLKNKTILSPMSGVTDIAFRNLARKYGAGMTYTEFVNSTAIVRDNQRTLDMIRTDKAEKPVGVQLFGSSDQDVVNAGLKIQDRFDVIDINCGCPAWKVIKTGAGSQMLKEPQKIAKLVNLLVEKLNKPITVKIRKGINEKTTNAVKVAKLVEDAGASAIAIHGRTQVQGYKGVADWDIIKKVKQKVNIPVIGNGDVFTPEIFSQRLEETNVDYILIARAAMKDPYIFTQINDYQKKGKYQKTNKQKVFKDYLTLAKKYKTPFQQVQKQSTRLTKEMKGGAKLRDKITKTKNIKELQELITLSNF